MTLTPASGRTVTVGWGTFLNIGQTAEEEDFTSFPQNGFVTFPPGQTTAQLQVPWSTTNSSRATRPSR